MKTKYTSAIFFGFFVIFPFVNIKGEAILNVQPLPVSCVSPANAIVAENCKEGTSDWQAWNLFGDIEGYASVTSVAPGEKIDFYVNTNAPKFNLHIYRSGYYHGMGGRLVYDAGSIQGQVQPTCTLDHSLGLINCINWSKSYSLVVPDDWVSGVYMAKLSRPDTKGESLILFVVREKTPKADIAMQLSVSTWQAYNYYGNKSVYTSLSFDYCPTVTNAPRAVKVSFNRPSSTGVYNQNVYFWSEYPMVYWLEAQGYDVGYITNIDTHSYGSKGNINELLNHRVFISVGHDEYWSQEMHDAIADARDQGVDLAFFSSNVSYWRIRLEPDPQTSQPDRTLVVYKTTEGGPPDPTGHPTTTWRDPAGVNNPENSLIGIQYIGDNDTHYFPLQVTAEQAQDFIYRNTALQTMEPGSIARIGKHLIGWEWDAIVDNGHTPQDLEILAESPTNGLVLADAGRKYNYGKAHSNVARYVAKSGAIVFSAGTNQWTWGLSIYEPNSIVQQITYNLFSDMGVHPTTPEKSLKLDDADNGKDTMIGLEKRSDASVLAVESFMQAWDAPDFKMPSDTAPDFVIVKSDATKPPQISNLHIISGNDTVTVSWDTDQPTDGQVWLKFKSGLVDYNVTTEAIGAKPIAAELLYETLSTHHELTIDSLLPNNQYFIHVASTNGYGQAVISNERGVSTQNGGSIGLQAKRYLRPLYRQVKCGWSANPWGMIALFVFGALISGMLVFYWRCSILRNRNIEK